MKGRWLKMGFAAIGMSSVMTACYGIPYEEYEVKGKVTDNQDNPIKGIQISSDIKGQGTAITDANGNYYMSVWERSPDGFVIRAKDIDGEENGGEFLPAEKSFEELQRTVNFQLTKKEE